MPFELFIALRYLLARRKQAFISLISLISTIGVAVGVMALIIALALMTGLQGELRDRILGSTAHIYVWKTGGIADYQAEVAKLLTGSRRRRRRAGDPRQGADQQRRARRRSSAFKGIDPALEPTVTDIQTRDAAGQRRARSRRAREDELPGILDRPGAGRAARACSVGDSVTLMTPQGTLSPMGMIPRVRRARVAGIYSLGLYEFDSAYGFVSLDVRASG